MTMLVFSPQLEHHLEEPSDLEEDDAQEKSNVNENSDSEEAPSNAHGRGAATDAVASAEDGLTTVSMTMSLTALAVGYYLGSIERESMMRFNWAVEPWMALGSVVVLVLLNRPRLQKWLQDRSSRAKEAILVECRLQLSQLLGSIAAPLLPASDHSYCASTATRAISTASMALRSRHFLVSLVQDFATPHVALLLEMDLALERLRSATSLSLGLGHDSPSVDRVERVALRRKHRRTGISRMRRFLSDCMRKQYRSLLRMEELLQGESATRTEDEIPDIISLSWLGAFRRRLAEQLSRTVSETLTSNMDDVPLVFAALRESGVWAQEAHRYLISVQDLVTDPQPPMSALQQRMAGLCRVFNSAHVALVAWQESMAHPTKALQWCELFQGLLQETAELLDEFHQHLVESDDSRQQRDSPQQRQPDDPKESRSACDTEKYEHGGVRSVEADEAFVVPTAANNKTLVFAGTGTVPKRPKKQSEPRYAPAASQASNNPVVQLEMLHELETRLATIRLDEARENEGDGELDSVGEFQVRKSALTSTTESSAPTKRTTSMFLGVSADLLREAQRSINETSTSIVA